MLGNLSQIRKQEYVKWGIPFSSRKVEQAGPAMEHTADTVLKAMLSILAT